MPRKLKSRKLWTAIVGFISGQAVALNPKAPTSLRIAGLLSGAACMLGYLFAESRADAAGAVPLLLNHTIEDDTEITSGII